jgi:hypothetical protein
MPRAQRPVRFNDSSASEDVFVLSAHASSPANLPNSDHPSTVSCNDLFVFEFRKEQARTPALPAQGGARGEEIKTHGRGYVCPPCPFSCDDTAHNHEGASVRFL